MSAVPALTTARLIVRPFALDDLEAAYTLFDVDLADAKIGTEGSVTRAARQRWLEWTVLNYEQLAYLHQPPYGDRAIVLRAANELIGSCGYVPCLNAFGQLPGLAPVGGRPDPGVNSTEFGLFWAIAPAHRRRGYATEAATALIDYAFTHLRLARVVATTDYDNLASMGVMRQLGMRLERNPLPTPPWLQVVGVLSAHQRSSPNP